MTLNDNLDEQFQNELDANEALDYDLSAEDIEAAAEWLDHQMELLDNIETESIDRYVGDSLDDDWG